MPEYEALDASGKLATRTIPHRDERRAIAKLEKRGLHSIKLIPKEEKARTPVNKFWNGTFFDTIFWLIVLCLPIAGLMSPDPGAGFVAGIVAVFFLGALRVSSGNWNSGN